MPTPFAASPGPSLQLRVVKTGYHDYEQVLNFGALPDTTRGKLLDVGQIALRRQ
ncbi:MAG: hypothetical protein ACT4O1_06780 [Gemmatimonadota bacterium]